MPWLTRGVRRPGYRRCSSTASRRPSSDLHPQQFSANPFSTAADPAPSLPQRQDAIPGRAARFLRWFRAPTRGAPTTAWVVVRASCRGRPCACPLLGLVPARFLRWFRAPTRGAPTTTWVVVRASCRGRPCACPLLGLVPSLWVPLQGHGLYAVMTLTKPGSVVSWILRGVGNCDTFCSRCRKGLDSERTAAAGPWSCHHEAVRCR